MFGKSVKSRRGKAIDRPFDPALFKRAKALAEAYQIVLHAEDGEYYGRGLEMPFVMSDGRTPDACVEATRGALTAAVATMLERGEVPPSPASEQRRSEQVNVRLTPEEKLLLEEAARNRGYRGIGDFVRSATLSHIKT